MTSSNQAVNQSVGLPDDYVGMLQGYTMEQLETERARVNEHIQYNMAALTRVHHVVETCDLSRPVRHNYQNTGLAHAALAKGFGLMLTAVESEIQSRNEAEMVDAFRQMCWPQRQ